MPKYVGRAARRERRHLRLRKRVVGTPQRPRMAVFRSLNHIYVQIIDDQAGNTLAAASTLDPQVKGELQSTGNKEAAKAVGTLIASRAKAAGIDQVVFDRGGNLYHGRVKELADAAREAGLKL